MRDLTVILDFRASFISRYQSVRAKTLFGQLISQSDVCMICDPSKLDDRGCLGAPDLVVEILSPGNSKREMKDKFSIYEESGVQEYWIVYLAEKSVQVFRLNDQSRFVGIQPFAEEDDISTPVIPGLSISLMEVFRD